MCHTPTVFLRFYQVDSKYFSECGTWMNSCFSPVSSAQATVNACISATNCRCLANRRGWPCSNSGAAGCPRSFFLYWVLGVAMLLLALRGGLSTVSCEPTQRGRFAHPV